MQEDTQTIDSTIQESNQTAQSATAPESPAVETPTETATVVRKKRKWLVPVIIGGIVALIVAIFAAVIVAAVISVTAPKRKLQKQLDLGQKYLTEMDYENAILAYQAAIQMNPKAEGGYLGLAGVYDTMADNSVAAEDPKEAVAYLEKAVDVLKTGEGETGSDAVKQERERLEQKKESIEYTVREQMFYKECYDLLIAYKSDINYYHPYRKQDQIPMRTVAFCDIYGDGLPEMVYATDVSELNNGYSYDWYKLHMVALQDGQLKDLIEPLGFDEPVAGSTNYVFFKESGNNRLHAFCEFGDEDWYQEVLAYVETADGKGLERQSLYEKYSGFDYDNNVPFAECKKEGQTITEAEFDSGSSEIFRKCNEVVFKSASYSSEYATDERGLYLNKKDLSMTYDEAIAFLEDWLSKNYKLKDEDEGSYDIFSQIPEEFDFASGAGAWGTCLTIRPDGTFEASYHDTNAGESGPGYDGTTYVSNCTGKFSKAVKINDYTYRFTLEEIHYDREIGKETYETENGFIMRYVETDCYGLEGGKTFYIFKKGAPVKELPSAFVSWVRMPMSLKDETELPFTGFYNAEMEEGFFSYEP